jgi:hypothetical protein
LVLKYISSILDQTVGKIIYWIVTNVHFPLAQRKDSGKSVEEELCLAKCISNSAKRK